MLKSMEIAFLFEDASYLRMAGMIKLTFLPQCR
ncbi:MAG: hypothetical protein JWQ79_2588 [Mucilaginibacter sp.]|nr:hypothetical protein [Mucilaginibacter sp.]